MLEADEDEAVEDDFASESRLSLAAPACRYMLNFADAGFIGDEDTLFSRLRVPVRSLPGSRRNGPSGEEGE